MKSSQEFLSVLNIVFPRCLEIKQFTDVPLIYKDMCLVYCVEQEGNSNYVICFDDSGFFFNVLTLYVSLKQKFDRVFLYASKEFKAKEKTKFALLTYRHISFVDDGGTYFCETRINTLEALFDDLKADMDYGYTKNTQLVFKYYLFNPVKSYTVRTIADFLKISPASVSRANETLSKLGVLSSSGYGAGLEYTIINKRDALKKVRPYFIRPFEKKYFLALDYSQYDLMPDNLISGGQALSEYTDLSPSSNVRTFAIYKKDFAPFYNAYCSVAILNPTEFVAVESYIYGPNLFSDGKLVDLFDLYVTVIKEENIDDPRVKEALKKVEGLLING